MRTTIAFLILLFPASLWAQDPLPKAGEATGAVDAQTTRVKKVTEHDFREGEDVTGEMLKPLDEEVRGSVHGKQASLIDVRSDFVDELLKSVDEI